MDYLVLMHKNTEVAVVSNVNYTVTVTCAEKLPFQLRVNCNFKTFTDWLHERTGVLYRVYASDVYTLRRLGRDTRKAIKDSHAISVIDSFWVTWPDAFVSWEEIQEVKDISNSVVTAALTGNIDESINDAKKSDKTTNLTLKGAYPKAVRGNVILKKGYNCEFDFLGFELGKAFEINTAEVSLIDDIAACVIFTSDTISLAHAREFEDLTDYKDDAEGETTDMHRALYEYFLTQQRFDLCRQLERVYLLKYIAGDSDFHSENFGVLYDSDNFTLHSIAPAYDFNKAFKPDFRPHSMYPWLYSKLQDFIRNNDDVYVKLRDTSDVFVAGLPYLDHLQKAELKGRIAYLLSLM